MPLLSRRFPNTLEPANFFKISDPRSVWKKLYSVRSAFAHGGVANFKSGSLSFGALVAENSLAQATLSRVYGTEAQGSTTRPPVDLTVLLNQAAPSMTAKRLQEALLDAYVASKTPPPVEQPMIVSVTSTDDNATRRAFPIARFFETILARGRGYGEGAERSQHTYMRQTAGHLLSMYTHRVVKRDSEGSVSLPSLPLLPSPLQSAPPPATTELMSKQNQD